MQGDEAFDALADACLKVHEAVVVSGTPAMIAITRALLWQIGKELAQRDEHWNQLNHRSEFEIKYSIE